ncbi:glycosyl hydrolase [Streptomyces sp. NPDC052676]|uniref:glycoside hydrolase family 26 protein n=1 Tax=Streptomyces sp. NPDC052676 TaxID=3154953 RepID=UPI00341DAD77
MVEQRSWGRRHAVLTGLGAVAGVSACSSGGTASGGEGVPTAVDLPASSPRAGGSPKVREAVARLVPDRGRYFGISTLRTPWSPEETDRVAQRAGVRPNLLEYFVKWNEDYRPDGVAACYRQGAVPLLTWEPWASLSKGTEQPEYRLARIAGGAHDAYVRRFARAVAQHGRPLILRFAHEMNGTWFSWAEGRNGNGPGEYVEAWRHVRRLFDEAGAGNVVWQWSPNILRTIEETRLEPLYPGDEYVDLVGLSGYRKYEGRAAEVFEPALGEMRAFTRLPLLISETGARPGEKKAAWTRDLFPWMEGREDVIGFVWFERGTQTGGMRDWRFAETAESLRAFQEGIAGFELCNVPGGEPLTGD